MTWGTKKEQPAACLAMSRRCSLAARACRAGIATPPSGRSGRTSVRSSYARESEVATAFSREDAPTKTDSARVGSCSGSHERGRAFVGIAVALVIDVVENEAVYRDRPQARECDLRDPSGLLRFGRQLRW